MSATITLDQMKDKLVSVDEVHRQLAKTEPLSTSYISSESKIKFHLDPDWAQGVDALAPHEVVGVTMRIDGVERPMTKEATFQALANVGIPAPLAKRTPASHITSLVNWHYSGGFGDKEYNVLSVGENVSAFTRPTLVPFSNLQLLESVVEGIQARHGADVPIFADYKFANSLQRTDLRLIIPTAERVIEGGGLPDVPEGFEDNWFKGIHLSNSLVGKTQTALEAYMFRWWCTNGATTTMEGVGNWSRRVNGQQDDVYEWAREQVDEILGGLEFRFDQVQSLVNLGVSGNLADILREIFQTYEVPVSQRDAVREKLEQMDLANLTMYSIMNAITEVANEADMDDRRRDRLMRIGGAIPTEQFDTLKARVWREGHTATSDHNPYEIQVLSR